VIQGLATAYLDPWVGGAVGAVLPFVIMLLILLVKPTGCSGGARSRGFDAMDPAGVFAVRYAQDRALVRTRKQWLALAILLGALALMPLVVGPRLVAVGNIMLISAIVVVGLQICNGYAGQVNLARPRSWAWGRTPPRCSPRSSGCRSCW